MTQTTDKNLDKVIFENRAWINAEHPRLHMKEPEKIAFTEFKNFEPITSEVHLSIGYHYGRSQRSSTDRWYLGIDTYEGNNCCGEIKLFGSINEIKEHIKEKYGKNPILPKRWN